MRRVAAAFAVLLVLVLSGCGGSETSDSAPRGVVELTRLDALRAAFNEDEGRPRLVLLLSPT